MKKIFFKYYLPFFSFVLSFTLVAFVSSYFGGNKINDVNSMVIAFIILNISLTLILGTIYYKYGNKWKIKFKQKVLQKNEVKLFYKLGFYESSNQLLGYIDGYLVVIIPEKDLLGQRKWIDIKVFFNPKKQNQFIPEYKLQELNANFKKNMFFNRNCVHIEKDFTLLKPIKFSKLHELILKSINVLKSNNIESIELGQLQKEEKDLLNFDKQVRTLKL